MSNFCSKYATGDNLFGGTRTRQTEWSGQMIRGHHAREKVMRVASFGRRGGCVEGDNRNPLRARCVFKNGCCFFRAHCVFKHRCFYPRANYAFKQWMLLCQGTLCF
ncbi:hypothetical protein SUGI_0042130 [Cryptomeria japonica]|nr:hypothetical protein SUGI_0042130 [Cryptomeria japonica]